MSETKYLIFRQAGEAWLEEPPQTAASSKSAIRKHLTENGANEEKSEMFAAVPARSWQPVKVQVETALKFS